MLRIVRGVLCVGKERKKTGGGKEERGHLHTRTSNGEEKQGFPPHAALLALLAGVAAVGAELHAGARAAALGAELGAGRRRRGRGRSLGRRGRSLGRLRLDLLLGQRTLVDLDLAGVRVARTVRRQGAAAATKAKALLAKELVVARRAVHHTLALVELGDLKLLAAVLAVSESVVSMCEEKRKGENNVYFNVVRMQTT